MFEIDESELVKLLKEKFKDKDGYIGGERTIQRTNINDNGEIITSVYRSNQSSIHYNYKINMIATISNINIHIKIDTETATSNGDPYCGRGMRNSPNEITSTKSIREFNNNIEIVDYISSFFYKHYFRIEGRN